MKLRGKHTVISVILLIFGFFVTYSFQQAAENPKVVQLSEKTWDENYQFRQQAIDLVDKNKQLRDELEGNLQRIQELETKFANQEELIGKYVEQKKRLQILNGDLTISGDGITVTLHDANYIPNEQNANDYMVHESHIHKIVNELFSAGAKAVAINGQRVLKDTYIACVGPVITVDGVEYPAPFVVRAIGDPDVLYPSITLTNGVRDQLVNENIEVDVSKENNLVINGEHTGEQ
ncbi:DUF881 domain-containing protein [Lentibacillus sp. Marseille-P4043]|uniref:DUF881 domain-containing protein n=1 Tax=Lentibacillus sp. Marseille-P4043 TaxID=2040293 RepID=UPI000D0B8309|nr:DUF881 domain-containing protein [Lentibacillus sp. Marseille-P4043]